MQRDSQFHRTETGREVSGIVRQRVDYEASQFLAQLWELLLLQLSDVGRRIYLSKQRIFILFFHFSNNKISIMSPSCENTYFCQLNEKKRQKPHFLFGSYVLGRFTPEIFPKINDKDTHFLMNLTIFVDKL
jgi:hypothetical protein